MQYLQLENCTGERQRFYHSDVIVIYDGRARSV